MQKRNGAPVNLYLNRDLVEAAKGLAKARDMSLSDFVERAIKAKLKAQARKESAP